jgi:prepilin-type N-terminal cleavage/methylation domain-containing protein
MNLRRPSALRPTRAFTLIEIMVVVGIMGLILVAFGIPSIYSIAKKEGMRRAVGDLTEVLGNARAQAILRGTQVEVKFYPLERRFEVSAAAAAPVGGAPDTGEAKPPPNIAPGTGLSGIIPEDINLEMLDVNLFEYNQSEWTRVRFFPNGTSDELTVIYRSNKNEYRKVTLEPTTGLAIVGDVR